MLKNHNKSPTNITLYCTLVFYTACCKHTHEIILALIQITNKHQFCSCIRTSGSLITIKARLLHCSHVFWQLFANTHPNKSHVIWIHPSNMKEILFHNDYWGADSNIHSYIFRLLWIHSWYYFPQWFWLLVMNLQMCKDTLDNNRHML